MPSVVDPHSGALPEEPEESASSTSPGGFGLDGALVPEERGVSRLLRRRLRRQTSLYGHETARRYLARLLELDPDAEDVYEQGDQALGVRRGSLRDIIEGPTS